jgi:hypothetical protein
VLPLTALALLTLQGEDPVEFNREVRPLLADRCFACHGPDEAQRKAGLRLDLASGAEGAYRSRAGAAALRPGSLDGSELWARVASSDPSEVMPPPEAHVPPLDAEERALLRRWIEEGAVYADHWAFIPAAREGGTEGLDVIVARRLARSGLTPSRRADRRTLIRRLSLDLTGLPPTRADLHQFLADDAPHAYERVVDELLGSPRYGEHMAKAWLDLVRFADTNGVHHDHLRDLSPYRDWVIRAYNDNLAYDRFVVDQLAGDLHPEPSSDQLVASGFNRLHMIIDRGTALPEESFARNVIDRVTAVGTAFLGLTVQCAVCHDHKYDPFSQRDFYRLSAFFNNLDGEPETGSGELDKKRGLQPPYLELPSEGQAAQLAELAAGIAAGGEGVAEFEARQLALRRVVPAAMVMRERPEPRPAFVLIRGAYDDPGERVERGTPSFLPALASEGEVPSRMDFARWLVSPGHPLTARVAVNRIWQRLFGVGLVRTSEDFGTQGEWPSHPDLLDELTLSFVESGWDVKALVRRIVLSSTYQQASAGTPESFIQDPENRLLARGARFRLDAEVIRDQFLASSGLLSTTMYGRSVKPPQPSGIWQAVTLPSSYPRRYEPDEGEAVVRRSIYTFWKRGMPPPQMSILNAPTREACTSRRERTNTPLQALLLLNESEYLRAAVSLAASVLAGEASSDAERLEEVYERITAHVPDEDEQATLLSLVHDLRASYQAEGGLTDALADGDPELAAWTLVANAVYNLDVTKTRQ